MGNALLPAFDYILSMFQQLAAPRFLTISHVVKLLPLAPLVHLHALCDDGWRKSPSDTFCRDVSRQQQPYAGIGNAMALFFFLVPLPLLCFSIRDSLCWGGFSAPTEMQVCTVRQKSTLFCCESLGQSVSAVQRTEPPRLYPVCVSGGEGWGFEPRLFVARLVNHRNDVFC